MGLSTEQDLANLWSGLGRWMWEGGREMVVSTVVLEAWEKRTANGEAVDDSGFRLMGAPEEEGEAGEEGAVELLVTRSTVWERACGLGFVS